MPAAVDHVADTNGAELFRLSRLYDFPDFVKKANLELVMRPGQLAVTVYADPVNRQFPCHNAPSTWLSAAYFYEKKAEFHPKDAARIEQRLDNYVDYWRIRPSVEALKAKHAEYTKSAADKLPDSAYAWVWVGEDGRKDRRLPLRTAGEVKQAADYLLQYADRFDFKTRNAMARKIVTKAAAYGANLGGHREWLEKTAGLGVGDPKAIVAMIEDRAKLATNTDFRRGVLKLAEVVRSTPRAALHPDTLADLCHTVEQIDRTLGVFNKYAAALPRPEDVIFSATFTKAAEELAQTCALTTGNAYRKEQFAKIALDDLSALFGTDFGDQVRKGLDGVDTEKLAELVATLPRPDAELFDAMMRDLGQGPALTKAASVRQGFTPEDYARMADAYVPKKAA